MEVPSSSTPRADGDDRTPDTTSPQPKKGVIKIGSVPRFMTPDQMRRHLSKFFTVTKLYLVPEAPALTEKRRKKRGKKVVESRIHPGDIVYKHGWFEAPDGEKADMIAAALDGQPMGFRKSSRFFGAAWNLRALPGVSWTDLSSARTARRREAAAELRESVIEAKRENQRYLELLEQRKVQAIVRARRDAAAPAAKKAPREIRRTFRQKGVKDAGGRDDARLLSALFD